MRSWVGEGRLPGLKDRLGGRIASSSSSSKISSKRRVMDKSLAAALLHISMRSYSGEGGITHGTAILLQRTSNRLLIFGPCQGIWFKEGSSAGEVSSINSPHLHRGWGVASFISTGGEERLGSPLVTATTRTRISTTLNGIWERCGQHSGLGSTACACLKVLAHRVWNFHMRFFMKNVVFY